MKIFLFLTAVGSVIGGFFLVGAFSANSAPQEAAAAALACAFAVVPYVFVRACMLYDRLDEEKRRHAELLAALQGLTAAIGGPGRQQKIDPK